MRDLELDKVIIGCTLSSLIHSYIYNLPFIFINPRRPLEYDMIESENLGVFGFDQIVSKRELFDRLFFILNLRGLNYSTNVIKIVPKNGYLICYISNSSFVIKYNKVIQYDLFQAPGLDNRIIHTDTYYQDTFHVSKGPVSSSLPNFVKLEDLRVFLYNKTNRQYNTISVVSKKPAEEQNDIYEVKIRIEEYFEEQISRDIFCTHLKRDTMDNMNIDSRFLCNIDRLCVDKCNPNYRMVKRLWKNT